MKAAGHRVFQGAIRKLLYKAEPSIALTSTCVRKQNEFVVSNAIQRECARVQTRLNLEDRGKFKALEDRLRTILPEEYQDSYEDVQPVSMGSAALKYGSDGKVAWNDIWVTFCDLAMAGGPPHKGTLLEPGSQAEIEAAPDRYRQVVEEICRGVAMVTGLAAYPSQIPGWVSVEFANLGTAEWLLRAITMENVSVRRENMVLHLPAGPAYRVEKEVKNVITAIAKISHYWLGHMQPSRRRAIARLFAEMESLSPLIQPALSGHGFQAETHQRLCGKMSEAILQRTGLRSSNHQCAGWLGVECPNVHAAIWMMRAFVACNVLSRREGTAVFVPVNPSRDPGGEIVARLVSQIHHFAAAQGVL
jgi:sirohydrochlorin cobaltochelatase